MNDTIRSLLDSANNADLNALKMELASSPPERIAQELPLLPPGQQAILFRLLTKGRALLVFELLNPSEQVALTDALTDADVIGVLEGLDTDDRTRLLDELPAKVAKRLVAGLSDTSRAGVQALLNYEAGSVGRVVSPAYVAVRRSATVGMALDAIRRSPLATEHLSTVFVIDHSRRYCGLVRLADLVRAATDTPVAELTEAPDVASAATDDAAAAARRLQRYNLEAIPVVDSANRLIGALTVDDAMDVLDMDTSATMYGKAGITDPGHATEVLRSERLVAGGIGYPVRVRLLFLMVTLAGGLAVGGLIEQFEDTLAAVVALAIFVPLVMDMGGNVGTQSTTIFARGLALGQIQLSHMRSHIAREARVGLVMGAVIGVVGGSIALVWQGVPNDIPQLGLAVGISLFVSVNLACFLGFFLPWVLIKLGFDHAPGADPFITTIKDFTGLLVYFGLAAWVLNIA